jgi:hypothetical protein
VSDAVAPDRRNDSPGLEALHRAARTIRLVLTVGAAVFAAAGVVLLVAPGLFAQLLGLAGSDASTTWSLRMVGAALVPLAGLMVLVRRLRDHHAVGAALVMLLASLLMTVLTLTMPGAWTFVRAALLGIGLVFSGAYITLLVLLRRANT